MYWMCLTLQSTSFHNNLSSSFFDISAKQKVSAKKQNKTKKCSSLQDSWSVFFYPAFYIRSETTAAFTSQRSADPGFTFPPPVRHRWKMAHERLSSQKIKKRKVPGIKYSQAGSRTRSSVEINMNKTGYVHLRLSPKPTDRIFPSQ